MTRFRHAPRARENPLLQRVEMRAVFPQFRWCITRAGGVQWKGPLQPTPDSPLYEVRIVHERERTPRTYVDRPAVRTDAPHRYPDGSLCLYWSDEWIWIARESLAVTIVPWTAFWLYYYELWLVTSEWLGPSSPHRAETTKEVA